jgi:hypothetical protein
MSDHTSKNGDTPEHGGEAPDWHTLDLRNPDFLKLALITIEERALEHSNETRDSLKALAATVGKLAVTVGEASRTTNALVQQSIGVANTAFGEAQRARLAIEAQGVLVGKVATFVGIDPAISLVPPPMRERFDSLQGEVDLAELAATEARAEAKRAQERADAATAAAESAKQEASGATKAAGDAKLLNTEAVTSLKAIAVGVGKGVAALAVIGSALYGALQLAKQFAEQVGP